MNNKLEEAITLLDALDKRIENDLQTGVRTTSLAMVRKQLGLALAYLKDI